MRRSRIPRPVTLILGLGLVLSCSTSGNDGPMGPGDDNGSGTIGPAGGTVSLQSLAGVTVPADALDTNVTITVTPVATPGTLQTAGAFAQAYRFTPEGQQFLLPVQVFIFVPDAALQGIDLTDLTLLATTATGFEQLTGITFDIGAGGITIRGFTTHFSVISPAVREEAPPANRAPVANAGSDQDASVGAQVDLQGGTSSDPDGDALTFEWRTIASPGGTAVTLTGTTTAEASFTPMEAGVYEFELTVSDGMLAARDTVRVTVTTPNRIPTVDVGADQSITLGATATVVAQATDPDGDPLTFSWMVQSRPQGSTAALSSTTTATVMITPDLAGDYVLEVTVSDGRGGEATDTVKITAAAQGQNRAPMANAGVNQNATTTIPVTLNGTSSSDPDGDPLTFMWSLVSVPEGSSATIIAANSSIATFTPDVDGTYVVQLMVSDGQLSSTDTATITAEPFNHPPAVTLSLSVGSTILVGSGVTATGTFTDADGHPLTPTWTLDAPGGSAATLALDAEETQGTFTADVPGEYVVTLSVTDGEHVVQRQVMTTAFPMVGGTYSTNFTVTFVSSVCQDQLGLNPGDSQVLDMDVMQTAPDRAVIGLQSLIPNVKENPVAGLSPDGQAIYTGPITLLTGTDPPEITANGTLSLGFEFDSGIAMPATGFDGGFSFTAIVFLFQCTVQGTLVSPPN